MPAPGTPPPAVANNIFGRLTTLAARIKLASGYTESIGLALGVIGAEQTVDLNSLKPSLTADSAAGQVVVGWTKQGMDGVEIEVDRGDGKGFVFLAIDTVPDYTDTQPMPPSARVRSGNTRPSTARATPASASGAPSRASRWGHSRDTRPAGQNRALNSVDS